MIFLFAVCALTLIGSRAEPEDVFSSMYKTSDYESTIPVALQVNGILPPYLAGGRVVHNGCGGYGMGGHSFSHAFGTSP